MNGSQHYAEAERLMADVKQLEVKAIAAQPTGVAADALNDALIRASLRAQVHATLALTAITAKAAIGDPDPESWLPVIA